jgi:hypothetical protein
MKNIHTPSVIAGAFAASVLIFLGLNFPISMDLLVGCGRAVGASDARIHTESQALAGQIIARGEPLRINRLGEIRAFFVSKDRLAKESRNFLQPV